MLIKRQTYILVLAVILSAIVGLLIMAVQYNKLFNDSSSWVNHTINVLEEGERARSSLHRYDMAKEDVQTLKAHFLLLRNMTSDNRLQQRRTDSLLELLAGQEKVTGQFPGPDAQKGVVDSARELLLRLEAEEDRLLTVRQAANSRSLALLRNATLVLLIAVFSLLFAGAILVFYNFNRRKRAEKTLSESEQRFDLSVDQVKEYAIYRLSPTGIIQTWNKGAELIKGYARTEIIGRHFSIFYTEDEILRGEPTFNIFRAAEQGQFECTGLRKRKDGSVFHAHVVFTALRDRAGQVSGFVKITQDIDSQVAARQQIDNALTREKELNELKSRFVALASHEFKTPLSVILSSASLIQRYNDPATADKRDRHLQRIKANVNNLTNLLNDFLSLEKLEQGTIENVLTPTDLQKLCRDTIEDMEGTCKEGQQIELVVLGETRLISMDAHIFRNILNNLLSNAIKYSPEQSLIRLTLEFDEQTVRIRVADKGVGIPADEQQRLFQQFFRAKNTTGISGTGLGLSIVKKYLDLVGGSISFESRPGDTIFTVTLAALS